MKTDALAVANYLLDLAKQYNEEMTPLKLMKLVYMAHGFTLAFFSRSALNPLFDRVEAWKYGPVIPSVYHSFKVYGKSPITKKTTIFTDFKEGGFDIITPELTNEQVKAACQVAYANYGMYSGEQLVNMLHSKDSPWGIHYVEGENREIPDKDTKLFFKIIIDNLLKARGEC